MVYILDFLDFLGFFLNLGKSFFNFFYTILHCARAGRGCSNYSKGMQTSKWSICAQVTTKKARQMCVKAHACIRKGHKTDVLRRSWQEAAQKAWPASMVHYWPFLLRQTEKIERLTPAALYSSSLQRLLLGISILALFHLKNATAPYPGPSPNSVDVYYEGWN
jgi:hypothetical protein